MLAPTTINFLRAQHRVSEAQEKLDRVIFQGASVVAGISTAGLIALLVWWQYGSQQLQAAKQQEAAQARVIAQSAESEAQYLSFVTRLDEISRLLQNRNSKKEALDFLSLLALPTVGFDSIVYDARAKQLTFRVQAENVFSVEEFLELLRQDTIRAYYADVSVSNIRRDDQGAYILDVIATLQGETSGS